ncbi:MAG: DUF4276 family protein [Bacteroidales bacterium]|nr:DUF4276 family protein [Bacteroidales bacterium]
MEKRLVFIVEGDCELNFVNQKLIPYLYTYGANGWLINAQKITTNRKLKLKGGNICFEYLRNEVKRISAQGKPWITTFIDFYRLPNDFPGYTTDGNKIDNIESEIIKELNYNQIIPYIQKFEFETLLFANTEAFKNLALTTKQLELINEITQKYQNIEDINGGKETSPSKRLKNIFNYHKVADSIIILKDISIETLIKKSKRFEIWINKIKFIINN